MTGVPADKRNGQKETRRMWAQVRGSSNGIKGSRVVGGGLEGWKVFLRVGMRG